MTDDQLLARADALQREARDFVAKHRIDELLAPLGRVIPVGSLVTGLMVWRDVDYTVDARGATSEDVWRALLPLVHACASLRYEDETAQTVNPRHYFVFRIDGWKLDVSIWTGGAPQEVEAFQGELAARLDDETRLTILRLKDAWHTRPEYPEVVGGYEICDAVLHHGVRTVAELERHLTAVTSRE